MLSIFSYSKLINGKSIFNSRLFGVPLIVRQNITNGYEVRKIYTKLLAPFLVPEKDSLKNGDSSDKGADEAILEVHDASYASLNGSSETPEKEEFEANSDTECQFYLTNEKVTEKGCEIGMEELVKPKAVSEIQYVLVSWSQKMVTQYNIQPLSLLPEVSKSAFFSKRPQESVSLYKCLEAFLKEEPLGPDDMWSVS